MEFDPAKDAASQFQKGYRAVPIAETDRGSFVRLCVVVRDVSDPVAGIFVLLRDTFDSTIYLGCVVDAGGFVHQWVELWLQNSDKFETRFGACFEMLSNHALDERWKNRAFTLAWLDRANLIEIPAQSRNPLPMFFDVAVSTPLNPRDSDSSATWELCLDDRLLTEHGLPPYSTSLSRYLYLRDATSKPTFLPVTTGSPRNDVTQELETMFGPLMPFNPNAGLMMVRKFAPLSFEAHLDVLSGGNWKGIEQGEKVFRPDGVYRTLQNANRVRHGGVHLFLGKRGLAGRLVEAFYLKLEVLSQAFRLVRDCIRAEQLPFLNLSADSFRVTLSETGSALPFLWTAKVALAVPGAAMELPIQTSNARYFIAPSSAATSLYTPQTSSRILDGRGGVRISKLSFHDDGAVVVEGTLSPQGNVDISGSDLIFIRLMLSPGRVDLYGNFIDSTGHNELRFRTFPQKLPEPLALAIQSAEEVFFPNTLFETLPLVSSPLDLYSLGVLGVRSLLVNNQNTLAIALEEISNLARQISTGSNEKGEVSERIRALVGKDFRLRESIGPHRLLLSDSIPVEEAFAFLPAKLWWDTIAALIRCFPGGVRSAVRADFGNAPPSALDTVFEPLIDALDKLLMRARSLLFLDSKYSSEVNEVILETLRRHLEESSTHPRNQS